MAGKIIADTLEHSTAGSIATNYVVKGSAKAWVFTTDKTSYVPTGSFNVSSITDNGVGRPETNFSNSFNDTNISGPAEGGYNRFVGSYVTDGGITTTSFAHCIRSTSANSDIAADGVGFGASYHGDLA